MYLRMVPDLGGRGRDIVSRVLVGEPRRPELARAR
jgi:hypothetical protein